MHEETKVNWDIDTEEGLANAVKWQQSMISSVKQSGVWFVPRGHSMYAIDHKHKVAKKITGFPEPTIKKVFNAMGWTVDEQA